jgi:hypothetical protein
MTSRLDLKCQFPSTFWDKRHRFGVAYGERQGREREWALSEDKKDIFTTNYYRRSSGWKEVVFSEDWIHWFIFYSRASDGYIH